MSEDNNITSDARSWFRNTYKNTPPVTEPEPAATPAPSTGPLSDTDLGNLFFGGTRSLVSVIAPAISDAADQYARTRGLSPEQQRDVVTTWAHARHDASLSVEDTSRLFRMVVERTAEELRPGAAGETTEAKEQRLEARQREESSVTLKQLEARYGDRGEKLLQEVDAWWKAQPQTLRDMVGGARMLSHPDVILPLVERAAAGTLRVRKR